MKTNLTKNLSVRILNKLYQDKSEVKFDDNVNDWVHNLSTRTEIKNFDGKFNERRVNATFTKTPNNKKIFLK